MTTQPAWGYDNFTVGAPYTHADDGNWNSIVDGNDYAPYAMRCINKFDKESEWIPSSFRSGVSRQNLDQEDTTDTATTKTEDSNT